MTSNMGNLRREDRRRIDDSGDTTGDDRLERSYFMSQASLQRSGHWLKSSVHVVLGPLYDYNEINAIQLCSIRFLWYKSIMPTDFF